jgi:hypothetical protein
MEKDRKLTFLDFEVRRNDKPGLLFKLYRKPTNTQRFNSSESHLCIQHKMAAFNSMTNKDHQVKINYIYKTVRLNGYGREPIKKLAIKYINRQ